MIPPGLQPHTLSIVTPDVVTGEYGVGQDLDYDTPTARTTKAYVQPVSRRELALAGDRQALPYEYVVYTNDTDITRLDRITWNSNTYEVIGIELLYGVRGDTYASVTLHRMEG